MPSADEETAGHDGVAATLEQCRAQNRQLISEMREFISFYLTQNAQNRKHFGSGTVCNILQCRINDVMLNRHCRRRHHIPWITTYT